MSWHGAHGKPDPFRKKVTIGEKLGDWVITRELATDAHYGVRVEVRCTRCRITRIYVQTQLRWQAKKAKRDGRELRHRGCK